MKKGNFFIFTLLCLVFGPAAAQTDSFREGQVSYITPQNVYVKYPSTEGIRPGDTLEILLNGKRVPGLVVKNLSSISCVCTPLVTEGLKTGDVVTARIRTGKTTGKEAPVPGEAAIQPPVVNDSVKNTAKPVPGRVQDIHGNVSVASYLNFSSATANNFRMRYTVAFTGKNLGNSRASAEAYITFAHRSGHWDEIQANINNGLKVYNLSVNYAFNTHHQLWAGRRINQRLSNAGAIDGLQYEMRYGNITAGVFGGTRPDYRDYGFNGSLPQFGGYLGHDLAGKNGNMQTTVAFIQQMNSGETDRRFAYLQHVNALVKNLYFFGSAEVDLYEKKLNPEDSSMQTSSSPKLSNLYLSLRYRPVRQLSLTISYSERSNIIYYESYKDIVETLLEAATVRGWVLQASYRPGKVVSLGITGSYRDSRNDPRPTKSIYGFLTFAAIPGTGIGATLSTIWLGNSYLEENVISALLSRDLVPGKLSTGAGYRFVSYRFYSGESKISQHMPELNLTWRILKKLLLSAYYEGTFQKGSTFNRVYLNVTQRF